MSVSSVGANAQPSDAIEKIARAPSSMRLRPKRSPRCPYSGAAIVAASRYETTTQEISAKPLSELPIVGKALASIVWSAAARNIATITPGKTRRNAWRLVSGAPASARSGVGTLAIAIDDQSVETSVRASRVAARTVDRRGKGSRNERFEPPVGSEVPIPDRDMTNARPGNAKLMATRR